MKNNKLYNLVWKVNGITKETIMYQKPLPLVNWKKKRLLNSSHTKGTLVIV